MSTGHQEEALIDWDDALDNIGHVPGADVTLKRWKRLAEDFRRSPEVAGSLETDLVYGPRPRNRVDIIRSASKSRGLVVFIHGGYWIRLGKEFFTHLAEGIRAAGFDVAVPGYTLAPEARISGITAEVATAVEFAARHGDGPVTLVGHSAGGHLATRMICDDSPLSARVRNRLARVVAISGLFDLRPLLLTEMNGVLNLDDREAREESPVFHRPVSDRPGREVVFWVGALERPEFLRQTQLIYEAWKPLCDVVLVHRRHRDHFTVIEDLADPESALVHSITGARKRD